MLSKAVTVAVTGLSLAFTMTPPSSSRTVSKSKDKINVEGRFIDQKAAPYILIAVALIETVVYLLLMHHGRLGHNQHKVAMQQLRVLETKIRMQYQLTIRPGHKLVKDGPYRLLLHPSYTAVVMNNTAVYMVLWNKGLWDVGASYLASYSGQDAVIVNPFGVNMGILVAILYGSLKARMFMGRYKKEEKMLQEHFGKEWDEYASKRWRFVPFVY
ncbi:hypothetical protein BGZ70_008657 [Mortierella alpina]|uniref:Protein-S-isoprenylcysteine O-methyltransferase n=1 Tax=Mortierella alpina TaxID=64518 RepID=A0A9P6JDY9_MORAP|nr:hypothetical protein BGZ70_008657 [Mortierella alpina]